jgi:PHD/YefM family antitoxin component YafN of YafNO toxin-antitoxin module
MIQNKLLSISDLRNNATKHINDLRSEKYILIHNKPKAVLINIAEYEKLKIFEQYKPLLESIILLKNNQSFNFLREEPDLYEKY